MQWRNKPLMRRDGDVKFKTGAEAAELLTIEAQRRDSNQVLFHQTFSACINSLAPVFDRNPKMCWIAKQLVEPERMVSFRVAWLDDTGNLRLNRGFRCQYSSTLGPYDGGIHFGKQVTTDSVKASAFDALCANSLSGLHAGAASGGADFDPSNKSEGEIQRFCQSYMTELAKYIGDGVDMPSMGNGVGPREIGYLYGQYNRLAGRSSAKGKGMMWGGLVPWKQATGSGVAHFAARLLADKKESLAGKRVLLTGSGEVALACAEQVLALGGIPVTLSDSSGHIYEEHGIDKAKLTTLKKIKADRGARIGRYIVASTTAKFSDPVNIFTVPCDVCIPCSGKTNEIGEAEATLLADHGCTAVIEGSNMPCTPEAITVLRKRGIHFGPYKASLAVGTVANGHNLAERPLTTAAELDEALAERADLVFKKIKNTAKEFNTRGDLHAGANIAAFIKVARGMEAHGAV